MGAAGRAPDRAGHAHRRGGWCGLWIGAVLADVGCLIPKGYADCDAWVPLLMQMPRTVCLIVYGTRKASVTHAHHIGLRVRSRPIALSMEGNRGFASSTNNGVAVD